MIDAVLFDFGGVIIRGPFADFAALAQRIGVAPDAIRDINTRNPDDNAWARAERGELDNDGFRAAFTAEAAALGHDLRAQDVLDVLAAMSPARDVAFASMLAAIDRCRDAGLKLGLVTNNVRPLGADPRAQWVFQTFDTVVESSVVGSRKPEPRIYELALERLAVPASRTVMIDDLGINLKTARALGMTTIKAIDPDTAAADLVALISAEESDAVSQ